MFTYDRRSRGESGDTRPYAIEREIKDLQAVIDAAAVARSSTGSPRAARWRWNKCFIRIEAA